MRSYSWRRHNHPFTLSFLEEVLRWVGLNEVHKAITLFLETLDKQPGSPQTQRWAELPAGPRRLQVARLTSDPVFVCLPGVCTESCCSSRWRRWAKTTWVGHLCPLTSWGGCAGSGPVLKSPFSLFLQLLLIKSTRRRTRGWAPRWGGRSCAGSERSLPAPKPPTADAASTRRCSAEAAGSLLPPAGRGGRARLAGRAGPEGDLWACPDFSSSRGSDFPPAPPRKASF